MRKFKAGQTTKRAVKIFVNDKELVLPIYLLKNIADDDLPWYLLSNKFDICYENRQVDFIELSKDQSVDTD